MAAFGFDELALAKTCKQLAGACKTNLFSFKRSPAPMQMSGQLIGCLVK
jgi:hypothetical protein